MPKLRVVLRQPVAVVLLLALFGVTAHAATITLFTSLDALQARIGLPDSSFNFDNQPAGLPDVPGQLSLDGLTILGDFRIDGGAINFAISPFSRTAVGFAMNFSGNNAFAWGTDIAALRGTGIINFSVDGLSAIFNVTSPGFIGFSTDVPFRAINATFLPFPDDPAAGMNFLIDNVVAHTVGAVPEPSTLLLLAAGAGLLRLYTRRRKPAHRHDTAPEGEKLDTM